MTKPKIGLILSSTRDTRFADRPANWLLELAQARGDADYEIVDLRDYPLPFFDAPTSPRWQPVENDVARRWASKVAEFDGYVFVTAEYNHSITGVLKNALDFLYAEPQRKPAAFLGYGAAGGARAVEQLRLILVELSMVVTKTAVHIGIEPFLGMMRQGKDFADYPYLAESVTPMLDELVWYASVLKTGRVETAQKAAA